MKGNIIISILFFLLITNFLHGAFQQGNDWSARAASMGGAFTSIADDASAPIYNPAGLAQLNNLGLLFNYSKPYTGVDSVNLNYTYFSLVFPMQDIGTFGLGWSNFDSSGLYNAYSILMSYGFSMDKIFSDNMKVVSLGINAKYLYQTYVLDAMTQNDPVFANGKSNGNISADIGLLMKEFITSLPGLALGFMIKDINQPDLGIYMTDPVYREFDLGVSYKIDPSQKSSVGFLPSLDLCYRNQEYNVRFGLESWMLNNLLFIHAGVNFNELTAGLGTIITLKNLFQFSFNYAFLLPFGIQGSSGSHQISITARL